MTSPAVPGSVAPGHLTAWGRLQIIERIGSGGFGSVYRARDPTLDREVALKILDVPLREPAHRTEVLREGRLLARVHHPNVVTVYGADEQDGVVGIWMELVHGRTLHEVVRAGGPMGPEEACIVGIAVGRALAAVHAANLIHRDVKAQNVMREDGGRIVLMDFGTSWELTEADSGRTVSPTGTPLYMAPELLAGQAPSVATDIYGLGVLLFYLVTGRHPVPGSTVSEIVVAHGLGRRRLLSDERPDLPAAFLRTVDRALAPSPERRFATAGAMVEALIDTMPEGTPTSSENKSVTSRRDMRKDAGAASSSSPDGPSVAEDVASLFEKGASDSRSGGGPASRRTWLFGGVLQRLPRTQRRYALAAVVLGVATLAGVTSYALHLRNRVMHQQVLAQQLFYDMKALDVQIATLEISAVAPNAGGLEQMRRYLERRRQLERSYEAFSASINARDNQASEQQRTILQVTRQLGECDVVAPSAYIAEVSRHIKRWQTSGRYESAIGLALDRGYAPAIAREFQEQGLPPQFFYLALVESGFDTQAVGPRIGGGIPKGMWQFTPGRAREFGLRVGPLAETRSPDRDDDRHDWQKATRAAVRYIKHLYSTDAQASGLLVIAAYNWGERPVLRLLGGMPANPRERNFWQFLEKYRERVTEETYQYVFSVVSAAVIGENPRLFGFPFDNPLAGMGNQQPASIAPGSLIGSLNEPEQDVPTR